MNSSVKAVRFWTPGRVALALIEFVFIAGIGLYGCSGPTHRSNNDVTNTTGQPSSSVTTGSPTPPVTAPLSAATMNTELKALDGSKFKLADYKGKVVIVNLWATWCGPCRSEIPDLIKVSQEFKSKGVEVIGLTNEDPETDEEKVKDFVSEFRIPYKIGWGDQGFALALMQGQVRNNIPQSFIISRDGRVLKRFVGFSSVETPGKLRAALEDAINVN